MAQRILYIVLGAIVVFGLLFLLWSWLFGGSSTQQNTGTFGTASSTNQYGAGSGGNNGNGETNLSGAGSDNNSANGTIPLGQTVGTSNAGTGSVGIGSFGTSSGAISGVAGVQWLGGGGSSGAIGSGNNVFNATGINSINSGVNGSAPGIFKNNASGNQGINLAQALAGVAIAGSLSCALQAGIAAFTQSSDVAPAAIPPGALVAGSGPLIVADYGVRAGLFIQNQNNATHDQVTFLGCITNTIAKVALQQITVSVVNWINTGFNGQPSFITNYQQFFTNVADVAAGQFIQGAGLAFLCSPFKLQIKIAIAKAYAQRNNAQSCTLTGVIRNVNNFMNGSFSQGGWPGFVSFTTMPANNPYGAFAYAQVGLVNAQNVAQQNARNNISPSGFLNLQQVTCSNGASGFSQAALASGALPPGCKASVTTPGTVIQSSLNKTLGSGVDQLGLANDLDQIINALTTQLITKTLYSGLTSLSQPITEDTGSEQADNTLIADIQTHISYLQQIGTVYQGSISDIENAQNQLNTLANCWGGIASSSSSNAAQAASNEQSALAQLNGLQPQVDAFNNKITGVNAQITTLEQFITQASQVTSAGQVRTVGAQYQAALASGNFPTPTDVTTAQQNRTTLQGQLSTINQATAASLQQCKATQ